MSLTVSDHASEEQAIAVLGNSLYPGAKPESVRMVLAYCRANGYDPMKKPVHIVPMSVKVGQDKYEYRDVVMPGIAQYRTDAARTGLYAGKSEPEFGPDVTQRLGGVEVTYPQWCKVTVFRIVNGTTCPFTAKEYWLENYATKSRKEDAPNDMWRRRAYGQLAKCAESQALRMAFPEQTGGTNTAEEMEGKTLVVEHQPSAAIDKALAGDAIPEHTAGPVPPESLSEAAKRFLAGVIAKLDRAVTEEQVRAIAANKQVADALANGPLELRELLRAALVAAGERVAYVPGADVDQDDVADAA
jgi:phage recombination protein Bet